MKRHLTLKEEPLQSCIYPACMLSICKLMVKHLLLCQFKIEPMPRRGGELACASVPTCYDGICSSDHRKTSPGA